MNASAERHSGTGLAYEHLALARPEDELGANLYDASRSVRMYQGMKLASFGTGLGSGLALLLAAQNNAQPQTNSTGTGTYLVAGTLAGASLVFTLLADVQVNKAGRLLQIASGRIDIGRRR